jgi:hypothetical protein
MASGSKSRTLSCLKTRLLGASVFPPLTDRASCRTRSFVRPGKRVKEPMRVSCYLPSCRKGNVSFCLRIYLERTAHPRPSVEMRWCGASVSNYAGTDRESRTRGITRVGPIPRPSSSPAAPLRLRRPRCAAKLSLRIGWSRPDDGTDAMTSRHALRQVVAALLLLMSRSGEAVSWTSSNQPHCVRSLVLTTFPL